MTSLLIMVDDLQALKESSELQGNGNLTSPPFIPLTGWCVFPSNNIPSLFNYGHVPCQDLESILLNLGNTKDIEDRLGHMTDKPMKNRRKYVDSGFVHDMMDTVDSKHYLVRAHVWASMRTELPHNVIVVISVNSGAVLHAPGAPCRASSLGRCIHVVVVLFSDLDYVKKHGPVLASLVQAENVLGIKARKGIKNRRE